VPLLEWGASSVVGVDISPAMMAVAESQREKWPEKRMRERLRFVVGDAATLGKVGHDGGNDAGQQFDLVTGMWLLNYARTTEDLRSMFETI
jgi:toxoflavin synthase